MARARAWASASACFCARSRVETTLGIRPTWRSLLRFTGGAASINVGSGPAGSGCRGTAGDAGRAFLKLVGSAGGDGRRME